MDCLLCFRVMSVGQAQRVWCRDVRNYPLHTFHQKCSEAWENKCVNSKRELLCPVCQKVRGRTDLQTTVITQDEIDARTAREDAQREEEQREKEAEENAACVDDAETLRKNGQESAVDGQDTAEAGGKSPRKKKQQKKSRARKLAASATPYIPTLIAEGIQNIERNHISETFLEADLILFQSGGQIVRLHDLTEPSNVDAIVQVLSASNTLKQVGSVERTIVNKNGRITQNICIGACASAVEVRLFEEWATKLIANPSDLVVKVKTFVNPSVLEHLLSNFSDQIKILEIEMPAHDPQIMLRLTAQKTFTLLMGLKLVNVTIENMSIYDSYFLFSLDLTNSKVWTNDPECKMFYLTSIFHPALTRLTLRSQKELGKFFLDLLRKKIIKNSCRNIGGGLKLRIITIDDCPQLFADPAATEHFRRSLILSKEIWEINITGIPFLEILSGQRRLTTTNRTELKVLEEVLEPSADMVPDHERTRIRQTNANMLEELQQQSAAGSSASHASA